MASADQNFSAPLRTNRKIAAMARSRPTKATKKFEAKHLTRIVEKRRIHKRNKDKYNKNKAPKKAAEQIAAEEGDAQKKTITHGKGSLFEGMTVDEFLESGGVDEDNLAFAEEDPTDELERSHKAGLKGLKEKDPGFYEFLRENDRELLEFDPDELVEEEDIEDVPVEGGLTESTLSNWDKSLVDERSLGTLKKVLIAVKHAAADITGSEPPQAGNAKYILTDPEAFDRLLLMAFQRTPDILQHHLPIREKHGKPQIPQQDKKFTQFVPLLKSLFQSTLVLLPNLTSPPTTLLVLSQTEKLIQYITGFRKLMKQLIPSILDLWSRPERTPDDDLPDENSMSEEQDAVKVAAFLWIRKVMVVGDSSLKGLCLKNSYAAFVRNARATNIRTLPHLNFLKNTLSELYGFDQDISYQHAFTFLRQLALHLRNSIATKSQESTRIVYCWQYINSLDFFSRMLSQHVGSNKSANLYPLVYPVIQIALGAIKLNPSSQYFPLRFHLVEALLRLSRQTGVYIPLTPILLEPLDSSLMRTLSAKKSDTVLKPVELEVTLRVSASYLTGPSSRVYRDQVATKLVQLLAQFFNSHALSPAFPELLLPPVMVIKRWLKKYGGVCGAKVRMGLSGLVEKLDEHAKWVIEKRQGLEFSPESLQNIQIIDTEEGPLQKWIKKAAG